MATDSLEDLNSESTQGTVIEKSLVHLLFILQISVPYVTKIVAGSDSNFLFENENCQSKTNDPVINTEGNNYSSELRLTIPIHMILN